MVISNFKLVDVIGTNAITWKFKAVVDVTKRVGFFRKKATEKREVFRSYVGSWYFIDNGEVTPGYEVEKLERSLVARKGKEIQHCLNA